MLYGDLKEGRERERRERERERVRGGWGGLDILDICLGSPMSINSVLDGLGDRRMAVIQDEASEIVS